MPKQKILVNKIPLTRPPIGKSQKFPKMSTLYLELIENKNKVKPALVNKNYEPPDIITEKVEFSVDEPYQPVQTVNSDIEENFSSPENSRINERNNYYSESEDEASRLEKGLDALKNKLRNMKDDSDIDILSDSLSDKHSNISENFEDYRNEHDNDNKFQNIDDKSSVVSDLASNSSNSSYSRGNEDLGNRLNKLLDEDDSENNTPTSDGFKSSRKTSKTNSRNYSRSRFPPTLAELEKQGAYEPVRHLENMEDENDEQDEEDLKREMLFKFELLKKSYTGADVPEFSIHSDYKTMTRTYENCVKRLSLDSTVDSYKQYLIYGFLAVELGLSYFFKFDMNGFTKHQIMNMNSYDKLLIELGEKSYVPGDSDWPVELRLLLLIIVNAAFFLGGKLLQNKTGSNIFGMLESMGNTVATSGNVAAKKRKMKGPEIDLDELPDEDI